jgi:alcohol dehydrogenase class IV
MIVPVTAKAMEDGCRLCNPWDVSEQDMIQLYKEAM